MENNEVSSPHIPGLNLPIGGNDYPGTDAVGTGGARATVTYPWYPWPFLSPWTRADIDRLLTALETIAHKTPEPPKPGEPVGTDTNQPEGGE